MKDSLWPVGSRLEVTNGLVGKEPRLLPPDRAAIQKAAFLRAKFFTPTWVNRDPTDAGVALIKLFGELMETVAKLANQLPRSALIDFLNLAGIEPAPPSPAEALVQFTAASTAVQAVSVPPGFQVAAQASQRVIFETDPGVNVIPGNDLNIQLFDGKSFQLIQPGAAFPTFGSKPAIGNAIYIGLSNSTASTPSITLFFDIRNQSPVTYISSRAPTQGLPQLRWEVLDAGSGQTVVPLRDETNSLTQEGLVEIGISQSWRPGNPPGVGLPGQSGAVPELRWLRVQLVHGNYPADRIVASIMVNVTRVTAAQTFQNEVLEPVPNTDGRQWSLSQKPILPNTLTLEIDDGTNSADFEPDFVDPLTSTDSGADVTNPQRPGAQQWTEVSDLASRGPNDTVYELDPITATVTFGDGNHGATPPQGFRNIRALIYKTGSGAASAVAANQITTMVSTAQNLVSVTNPAPASGGRDAESVDKTLVRGPLSIRSGFRAVASADFQVESLQAPGALIERAHAAAGYTPKFPGASIPGVVTVFIVPPLTDAGPPMPTGEALRAVVNELSQNHALIGIEIIASAPRYERIRTEVRILLKDGSAPDQTVTAVEDFLNRYLHPLTGGADGDGWPFGGPIIHSDLLKRLAAVTGVAAVAQLVLFINGVRKPVCQDYTPAPFALLWPEGHQVTILNSSFS
jgi:hypothetical protein